MLTAGGTQILPAMAERAASPALQFPPAKPSSGPGGYTPPQVQTRTAWLMATKLTSMLGDAAWLLHRGTYGRQLAILTVFGGAVWAVRRWLPNLYVATLFAYCSFLYLLILARLWWIRDDDGVWSWQHFRERFNALLRDGAGGVFAGGEFSFGTLLERMKLGFIAIGLAFVVLVPPVSALVQEAARLVGLIAEGADLRRTLGQIEMLGGYSVGFGVVLWLWRQLRERSPSAKAAEFKRSAQALTASPALPWFVDARTDVSAAELPTELRTLVSVLSGWRPRRSDESGYERSLVRFLERELPGTKTRTQQPISLRDGGRGELDVVVDDVLAIELKTSLRTAAEADRAVGQLHRYSESWGHGPTMLLVCDAREGFADSGVVQRVGALRSLGLPVFVVAAGSRPQN